MLSSNSSIEFWEILNQQMEIMVLNELNIWLSINWADL